jgi:hypothetical protein
MWINTAECVDFCHCGMWIYTAECVDFCRCGMWIYTAECVDFCRCGMWIYTAECVNFCRYGMWIYIAEWVDFCRCGMWIYTAECVDFCRCGTWIYFAECVDFCRCVMWIYIAECADFCRSFMWFYIAECVDFCRYVNLCWKMCGFVLYVIWKQSAVRYTRVALQYHVAHTARCLCLWHGLCVSYFVDCMERDFPHTQGPAYRRRYRYSLRDGRSGNESRWGRDFPHLSWFAFVPTQTPIQRVPGFFPGGKAAGMWR